MLNTSLHFRFPTKDIIPKSLKVGHLLSKQWKRKYHPEIQHQKPQLADFVEEVYFSQKPTHF